MNQILEESNRCAIEGAGLQTVHRLQICAPSNNSRSNVPFKSSEASRLLRQSQPFLADTCRLFRASPVRNVNDVCYNTHFPGKFQ
jgi:hypothetical protein